jgi:Rrf2 family protein
MAANSRMASAVQILCVIAYKGEGGTNSEVIANKSLGTNPVVVRRLLKSMEREGLVDIRPGKDGGVRLARDPAAITLDQIHRAVEGDADVFALRAGGNPLCPVERRMTDLLSPVFAAARTAVESTLRQTSLASLVKEIVGRHE